MPVCPQCGRDASGREKFCPECGAPLSQARPHSHSQKSVGLERRILTGVLGVLAFALCAIVLLLLDANAPADTIEARATAYSPTPSPTPSPVPSNEDSFLGAWTAARVEINKNKSKPYIEVGIGPELIVSFQEDGTITGISSGLDGTQTVQTFAYSAEGDSIYDDFGSELVDGAAHYTRVRYFFKNPGELRCVYLLDGREASDYILFTRLDDYNIPTTGGYAASAPRLQTATPPPGTSIATARPVEY